MPRGFEGMPLRYQCAWGVLDARTHRLYTWWYDKIAEWTHVTESFHADIRDDRIWRPSGL